MTKKFVFDLSEDDIIDISEDTVIRNTGVKAENVKEIVMKAIRVQGKGRVRRPAKKTLFAVAAAVAAAAVLGTASVGAAGGFNSVFGEYFAGEPANGVFSGKDVSTGSRNVDIGFKGIAGDDHQVIAMMTLKNKDGSPFVKETENTFIEQYNVADNGYYESEPAYDIHIEKTLWDNITNSSCQEFGSITYTFADDSTINAMAVCENFAVNSSKTLKGQRLSISDSRIYAYTPVKTLYTAKDGDGYSRYETSDDGSKKLVIYGDILEEMTKEHKSELKDEQVIMFDSITDSRAVIIADMKEIELDLNVAVTLNYKSTTRSFDSAPGKKYTINNSEWDILYLKGKSFTMDLSARCFELGGNIDAEQDKPDSEENAEDLNKLFSYQDQYIPGELTVTLEDGSVYKAVKTGSGSAEFSNDFGEIKATYYYTDESGNSAVVDPSNIVSVRYEGQELI